MTVEIRRVRDAELPAFVDALSTGFLERPDVAKVAEELRPLWDLERTWAAFDGTRICGTFRSWESELTVPGGAGLPAAAVSAVTVLPTHRRRGIMRSMVAAEHGAARERGEAVSLLYAAEYPIYGRFGYGPGCREATWTLDARATFLTPSRGTVEIVTPDEHARDAIKAVFDVIRKRSPGEVQRRPYRWDFDMGKPSVWGEVWKGFLALRRDASGAVDGYVRYSRAEDKWEAGQPRNTVKVDELHALNDEAYVTLWRFLAETDWVAKVTAERRSPSERLPWHLANARDMRQSDLGRLAVGPTLRRPSRARGPDLRVGGEPGHRGRRRRGRRRPHAPAPRCDRRWRHVPGDRPVGGPDVGRQCARGCVSRWHPTVRRGDRDRIRRAPRRLARPGRAASPLGRRALDLHVLLGGPARVARDAQRPR